MSVKSNVFDEVTTELLSNLYNQPNANSLWVRRADMCFESAGKFSRNWIKTIDPNVFDSVFNIKHALEVIYPSEHDAHIVQSVMTTVIDNLNDRDEVRPRALHRPNYQELFTGYVLEMIYHVNWDEYEQSTCEHCFYVGIPDTTMLHLPLNIIEHDDRTVTHSVLQICTTCGNNRVIEPNHSEADP